VTAERDVLRKVWAKEPALRENLVPSDEVRKLHEDLIAHLDRVFTGESLPALRYRKMRSGRGTAWVILRGYPADDPWKRFAPYLELLEQREAERTIKNRLELEGMFVESRAQAEDIHLLIGARDGTPDKAHIILDGKTGEIRVEDNRTEPTDLVAKIVSFITLKDGRVIRTTREAVELVEP
jgi:hypothetical protein